MADMTLPRLFNYSHPGVVESRNLTSEAQNEALDLLRGSIQEIGKKPAERNLSIFKLALQSIGPPTDSLDDHCDSLATAEGSR
jgi:hypothetical protein